jgi:hypothetical protein
MMCIKIPEHRVFHPICLFDVIQFYFEDIAVIFDERPRRFQINTNYSSVYKINNNTVSLPRNLKKREFKKINLFADFLELHIGNEYLQAL